MSESKILILSAADIRRAVNMPEAISLMAEAFTELSSQRAVSPLREQITTADGSGGALFMPGYYPKGELLGLKLVTVFKNNPSRGLPRIHGLILLFDGSDGRPLALMDGEYLTALRTGAASGLATDLLARKDSRVTAIIGAGAQGRTQLQAVCAVRPIEKAFIFSRTSEKIPAFIDEMSALLGITIEAPNTREVLRKADIVCTATSSRQPVFRDVDIKPGTHINAVGSYRPDMCELPPEILGRARIYLDQREACLAEEGEIIQAFEQGVVPRDAFAGELGELISGGIAGRCSPAEITVFKSVGVSAQDMAIAAYVVERAAALGVGRKVSL